MFEHRPHRLQADHYLGYGLQRHGWKACAATHIEYPLEPSSEAKIIPRTLNDVLVHGWPTVCISGGQSGAIINFLRPGHEFCLVFLSFFSGTPVAETKSEWPPAPNSSAGRGLIGSRKDFCSSSQCVLAQIQINHEQFLRRTAIFKPSAPVVLNPWFYVFMRLPPKAWIVLVPALHLPHCSVPFGIYNSSPGFNTICSPFK